MYCCWYVPYLSAFSSRSGLPGHTIRVLPGNRCQDQRRSASAIPHSRFQPPDFQLLQIPDCRLLQTRDSLHLQTSDSRLQTPASSLQTAHSSLQTPTSTSGSRLQPSPIRLQTPDYLQTSGPSSKPHSLQAQSTTRLRRQAPLLLLPPASESGKTPICLFNQEDNGDVFQRSFWGHVYLPQPAPMNMSGNHRQQ